MTRFSIFFLMILFTSCNKKVSLHGKNQTSGNLFRSIIFDGCEYVEIDYGPKENRVYKLIHKENCQNSKRHD